jgi:hypothetical protein
MVEPASDTWRRLEAEHREAVERFVTLARSVASERWGTAPQHKKWSPTQVTEHIALTYEVLLRELSGGSAMAARTNWWQRILLRKFILSRILKTGRIPTGATAPRELRPGPVALDRDTLLEKIRAGASRLDAELARGQESARLTHPYFGRLNAPTILRFCAIHTRHHAGQLSR